MVFGVRCVVGRVLMLGVMAGWMPGAGRPMEAQATRRARRESNVNRRARIERAIEDTYSRRYEVAVGGGYLRFRSGDTTLHNNDVTSANSIAYYLAPKLGIVGDLRASFGSAKINTQIFNQPGYPAINGPYRPSISHYTFMGGVRYRLMTRQKVAVSVDGLGGATYGWFDGDRLGVASQALGLYQDGIRPAFAVDLNVDYNFYPNLSVRLQPTYAPTMFGSSIQNNKGLNVQVVYRFGRIR